MKHCLSEVAGAIELLESESNDDFYNPKETLDKLNELVVYIAGQQPVAAVGILWLDDEGAEIVEELSVGDIREAGRWTQTVKEIVIREAQKDG